MASVQDRLRAQIEYYFSPLNLQKDEFLKSQMNADRYVPISVIAGFPKVKVISEDLPTLVASLASSLFVELNADKSALRAKQYQRNLLAIRNLPPTFPVDDIKAAFASKPEIHSKIASIKPDFATFVVTFTDAAVCVEAFTFLSAQQLNNQPVSCFIQSAAPSFVPTQSRNLFIPDANNNNNNNNKSPQQHQHQSVPGQRNQQLRNGRSPQQDLHYQSPTQHHHQSRGPKLTYDQSQSPHHAQPVEKIGYQGEFIKYDRKQIASLIESMNKNPPALPASFVGKDNQLVAPIILSKPHTTTSVLHPVPVMFPASPSPEMAIKQPEVLPPFLALGQTQQQATAASVNTNTASKPQSLPTLPPRGGIVLSSSAGPATSDAAPAPLTGLPPLTTTPLFKTLPLSSSVAPSTEDKDAKKVSAKKLTSNGSVFVPRSGSSPTGLAGQQGAKKPSPTNKDSTTKPDGRKGPSVSGEKTGASKSTSTSKPAQPRVDPKKRAAMQSSAFPSLGGKKAATTTTTTATTTTTTTTTPTSSAKLNFAATVATEAKSEDVEAQKVKLAALKRSKDDAAKAKALAEAKLAEAEVKEGEEATEAKEVKPKKVKKAKAEKSEKGQGEGATDASSEEKKTEKAQPKGEKPKKSDKKVEEATPPVVSPQNSWAAKIAQPKSQ